MCAASRRGFTLVEIMIAAVLASLVTLSAVSAVRIVTRGREKLEKYSEVNAELRYIAESMKNDLRNIHRSASERRFVGEIFSTEAGQVPSLTFYTTRRSNVRSGQPEGSVHEVQYTMGVYNGRNVMLRRLWPNPSEQLDPSGVVSILSGNVIGFDIRYLDDREWRNDWPIDMGRDCEVMLVSIVAQVPGESQRVVRSFMVNFPRRLPMTAASTVASIVGTGATEAAAATGGTSAAGSAGQGGTGSGAPGGSGGRAQDGGAGRRRGREGAEDGRRRPPGERPEGGMLPDGPPPQPPADGQGGPPGRRTRIPRDNPTGGAQQ